MGRRSSCCSEGALHRGPWTSTEDTLLITYIQEHGEGHWRALPKKAGLLRCGKSCRLRWMNYLRPDIKRGNITPDEDDLILKLHSLLGNRWSLIAGRLPGRTDNEIKNYWNSHLSKRLAENAGDGKKKSIGLNSENVETSQTRMHVPEPTRVSPSSPARPQEGADRRVEESRDVGGCEVLCKGSENSGSVGNIMNEVEDDYYQQLLDLKGEDYIQLESFIDYFLV